MDDYDYDYELKMEKALNTPVPWVGLYIAAASAVCTLAMAADAFNGFRLKKLWFPCKYFSLNATSLTLLAVAMKLPVDLNTNLFRSLTDQFAKYIGSIFMSTALANFMSSLGSMTDKEILANVVALVILVITIAADVCIQIFLLWQVMGPYIFVFMVPTVLMLLLLATLISLAVTVPSTKRSLESKYLEKHKVALREEEVLKRREAFTIDNQRGEMMKYWVMAETSSPQFVLARSVFCTTSAMICLLSALILPTIVILTRLNYDQAGASPYIYSANCILYVQSVGVVVGTIAPTFRWLVAVSFKCSMITNGKSCFKKEFKIEAHWIQTLVDWRDSLSALQIHQNVLRKYLHGAKWLCLTLCIGVQILIVLVNKLLLFLSALFTGPFFFCFTHIKKFLMQYSSKDMISNNQIGHDQSGDHKDLNLSRYVLLLQGEAELPRRVLKNICRKADNMIQTGKKKQPQSLLKLLGKFVNFNGVGQFDSSQIPSLRDSQEPPNCWTLPVVTLTSIAISLPNIAKHKHKRLLSSITEGLSLAKLVEKTLYKSAQLLNIRKAADVTWVGVLLYMKWLDIDLRRMSRNCKNSKEILQKLSEEAKRIITEFWKEEQDPIMENPLNWPTKVVAANSMYRISRTISLSCKEENEHADEELFERLSVMIADILAACLTNLPHVITTMCHHNAIEKREKSVSEAFLILGKTEEIVKILQLQEWPSLDHDKAAYIEEWRAWFQQDKDDPGTSASTSSDEPVTAPVSSSEENLGITVEYC